MNILKQHTLNIDVETFSLEDIKAGVHKYTTQAELLLFGYSYDKQPVQVVDLAQGEDIPTFILDALFDKNVTKKAWNAAFEIEQMEHYLFTDLVLAQWQCTMVKSARCGYPLSLGEASKAIGLPVEKDSAGKALIKLFSVPRKPTKLNSSIRVYPADAPEKWEEFKRYCKQDVVVEMHIDDFLSQYPEQPHFEHKMYVLDRQINKRGLELDIPFIKKAIQIDAEYKEILTEKAKQLTGLENPNSVGQLKEWLERHTGKIWKGLDKGTLKSALEENEIPFVERFVYEKGTPDYDRIVYKGKTDGYSASWVAQETAMEEIADGSMVGFNMTPVVKEALELRKELSNTSVRKYVTMLSSQIHGRIFDTIQFNGAGRTGRNAGRLIQPQNLPRVYMTNEELDVARVIVKTGSLETLLMCFDSVSSVLSQLIRTAIIASEGNRLEVVDLAAIEARVLAWLAGEEHVLKVFRTHGKIYEATAAMMFKVPLDLITKGSEMRQRGKTASLACIAEGQEVLTDLGLVKIEDISLSHKLWDGREWVSHDGVVFKGLKNIIEYDGLKATEDHKVWVKGQSEPIPFGVAAARGQNLLQSGSGRNSIWVDQNIKPRKTLHKKLVGFICTWEVRKLSKNRMGTLRKLDAGQVKGVSRLLNTRKVSSQKTLQTFYGCKTKMRKPERCELSELRRSGNRISVRIGSGSSTIHVVKFRTPSDALPYRSYRQQWELCKRQPSLCNSPRKLCEQEDYCSAYVARAALALFENPNLCIHEKGVFKGTNITKSKRGSFKQKKKLENHTKKVRVFDILNCGPRNRFTVSGVLVHNCGYQGGPNAITTMDLDKKIPDADKPGLVKAWREAHPNIVRYWYKTQNAAIKAIENPGEKVPLTKGAYFITCKDALLFYLPSGRYLMYPKVGLEEGQYGKKITFMGLDQTTNKWRKQDTYGGKLVENETQAAARDILMEGMYNMVRKGYDLVTNVHDETVSEVPVGFGSTEEIEKLMCTMPAWAEGLPLGAEGFSSQYYKK